MAAADSRKSEQDFIVGELVENDLIEASRDFYQGAIANIRDQILELPSRKHFTEIEKNTWGGFVKEIISCGESLFKISEIITKFLSDLQNSDFDFDSLEDLLKALKQDVENLFQRFFGVKEALLAQQKDRKDKQDSDIKFPEIPPPAKKPRTIKPAPCAMAAAAAAAAAAADDKPEEISDDDDDDDVKFNRLAPGERVIGGMPSVPKKSPRFGEK